MRMLGFPFKLAGLILLFFAFLLTAESWDDTFHEWMMREIIS